MFGSKGRTHYSTTSSSTMLTYTSNPRSVPTISLSDFMMIQMREPTHRSTSSEGSSCEGFVAIALVGRAAILPRVTCVVSRRVQSHVGSTNAHVGVRTTGGRGFSSDSRFWRGAFLEAVWF